MPKIASKRKTIVKLNLSGWDKAIADARKGITRLEAAIRVFMEKKANGDRWPSDSATHN
jgi:hypothetical protein